ncbi:solute carrier family 12 member 3-like [Haliotis asinina]|uniref:solute carrier family 12 member 3-like n=1 Tax=Haliotis asinina TaxID=109174 RepID=UPI0035327904
MDLEKGGLCRTVLNLNHDASQEKECEIDKANPVTDMAAPSSPSSPTRRKGQVEMDAKVLISLKNDENENTEDHDYVNVPKPAVKAGPGENSVTINIIGPDSEAGEVIDDEGEESDVVKDNATSEEKNTTHERNPAHQIYEKNLRTGRTHPRKISVYSQGSDHSGHAPSIVPSRKGSTVLIDEQPEIISMPSNYLSAPDDRAFPHGPDNNYLMSPRMSVFSMYSQASRGSFQSDRTFRDPYEVLPHADHYKNVTSAFDNFRQRPTLQQLREEQSPIPLGEDLPDSDEDDSGGIKTKAEVKPRPAAKLGWIQGVLVRCLLNIFGVMLFLRLTWITGRSGIGFASVIILLSAFVTSITTMSMAAICTNGEVRGGGAYYMISRSLGPEFGGAIGIVFSLANAVAAAMYVVGFAETVRDLMWEYGTFITGDSINEVRIIGVATSFLILGIVLIGLDFESKAQLVLLVVLMAAIVNFFVGTFLPATPERQATGFVGYSGKLLMENFGPDFRETSFFQVFAIFFPAATGILAGANISGDLKNPSTAIPRGTFLAIFLTTVIYLGIVWACGSCLLRDAVGFSVLEAASGNISDVTLTIANVTQCGNTTCKYGLQNDNGAVGIASAFKPLILAGIFSATLSSALASIVSAPKVFQALGKDGLFPFIGYFAKGFGKSGEPKRGYFLTFGICIAMTCVGALDIIAPIISNFFLMAYALINFSCFDASFANSPGFRPAYKLYNKWVSLLGALLCLAVMFLINWWAALVTFVVITALYLFLKHRKPDVNWGSSTQAHAYKDALQGTLKLADTDEHVKNYRPQILVLSGYPRNRPALVDFVSTITQKQSLLICAHVLLGDLSDHVTHIRSTAAYKWFSNRNLRAFYTNIAAPNLRIGIQAILQTSGVGKLRPNTIVLGYKGDWQVDDPRVVFNYFCVLHDACDLRYGVGILRSVEGFDIHKVPDELLSATDEDISEWTTADFSDDEIHVDKSDDEESDQDEKHTTRPNVTPVPTVVVDEVSNGIPLEKLAKKLDGEINVGFKHEDDGSISDGRVDQSVYDRKRAMLTKGISVDDERLGNRFRRRQVGTIDVWWLFDDGGLTLLLPQILSTRKQWRGCKLRVFCAGTKRDNMEEDHRRMASLLSKFRIDYSQITVIPDIKKKPKRASYKEFESMIYRWRLRPGESQTDLPWKITDSDLRAQKHKTYMKLRLRELLLENSTEAALIVMTLPVLRKTSCPAGLYMAWLEILTSNLPPTLLLRGNQESVLTYFS